MRVRLTTKLAEIVDGIDLSHCDEGDVIELPERDAQLIIAEHWAEPVREREDIRCVHRHRERAVAADEV